ncbi:speckle-type POZ protein-like [Leptopilina heterotoma]|uniref:speckle-type POZ protein-like n=1 Tax=Leptopilina heterotoma TaxID=63436 RepID=UPI001CAA00FA|nr:speckle-type POZ protein-like [Leptopilina heterotoma]XP_043479825.1 speckle-type POZ protein-like [Leptopilina heterotoma]XP_043479826.1 speckle-type POZ protein-like [Leptopilina heterotoma]XP_043479827.1 speckle-type POZ protein-like [Leptopilina heterotoma]
MATSRKFISLYSEDNYKESHDTFLNIHNYEFEWTINNFEFVCRNIRVIRSEVFSTKNFKDGKWIIVLEPTELIEDNNDCFKIHLLFYDAKFKIDKKLLNAQISFQRKVDSKTFQNVKLFDTENAYRGENKISWTTSGSDLLKAFIYSVSYADAIPHNVIIKCKINIVASGTTIRQLSLIDIEKCNGLVESNKNFLDNDEFKDVTFNVENQKFTAHKIFLASRSPVFAAMFKNKMSEGLTSIVEIDDIKPAIFQKMMNFIYTDRVENLEESAVEFLYVAEKYQLEKLKSMCINSLHDNLSLTTVSKTLEVADLYSIENLKNECFYFISERKYDIIETKEFQELMLTRPNLWVEILNTKETEKSSSFRYKSYELRGITHKKNIFLQILFSCFLKIFNISIE